MTIRRSLTLATCALLAPHARAETPPDDWRIDSSVLFYSEKDRVSVVEPVLFLRKKTGEESFFNARLVVDVMSGASPNGATPTNVAQTFTSPSGNGYTVPAGQTPLHDFQDTRVALALEWERPLSRLVRTTYGINGSVEIDYASFGGSGNWMFDFNDKLTTLTLGVSANFDIVKPEGGVPAALQPLGTAPAEDEEDFRTKKGLDTLVGITQVLSRQSLTQLNYSLGRTDGYMTDPYKVVSLINPLNGTTVDWLNESRPDSRTRQSLFWKYVYHFGRDVAHFSYRHYWDDWGVKADTFDFRYRWELTPKTYLQPHVRYSTQGAADFYRHSLVNGDPLPTYASADYRLGDLVTTTVGFKYGIQLGRFDEFSFRLESMTQSGESHPADAIGIQKNYDLFPTVKTLIAQITYVARF